MRIPTLSIALALAALAPAVALAKPYVYPSNAVRGKYKGQIEQARTMGEHNPIAWTKRHRVLGMSKRDEVRIYVTPLPVDSSTVKAGRNLTPRIKRAMQAFAKAHGDRDFKIVFGTEHSPKDYAPTVTGTGLAIRGHVIGKRGTRDPGYHYSLLYNVKNGAVRFDPADQIERGTK